MANASSSLVVEMGFLTVEQFRTATILPRVLRPAGRDIGASSFNTSPRDRECTAMTGTNAEASPSKQVPARHPIVIFHQCV